MDSSLIDLQGQNRVYVFTGNVTPDDDDGDSGDPVQIVPVTQDEGACTFSYEVTGLTAGTYTLAFTNQGQNDRMDLPDTITFSRTATVTVGSSATQSDLAPQSVIRVGPGRSFTTIAAAAATAGDNAVIEIDAGTYNDDIVVWRQNGLTVRGVGGRAHVHGTKVIGFSSGDDTQNGKGLWVVRGTGIRVEHVEFSGARVTDQNGAGIRNEGRNLTVCDGSFHDSENGFLGGAYGTLTVEHSQFFNNGSGDVGHTHNIYVDDGSSTGDKLVFQYNWSHDVHIGHTLKTRARENYVLYNRLTDETTGTSSYNIDVPNGGLTYVIGNLIHQGPNTDNSTIIAYGAEGLSSGRTHNLYLVNNTIVNDRGSGAFVDVAGGTALYRAINNLFVGSGSVSLGSNPLTNLQTSSPGLVDRNGFDYHLASGSPAINAGTAPGTANGFDLTPKFQYVHPAGNQARGTNGAIDIGAYEFFP